MEEAQKDLNKNVYNILRILQINKYSNKKEKGICKLCEFVTLFAKQCQCQHGSVDGQAKFQLH